MKILTIDSCAQIKAFDPENPVNVIGKIFNEASLISVCAWCYPKREQEKLLNWGFTLSHGICGDCKNNFISGKPQTTIKTNKYEN